MALRYREDHVISCLRAAYTLQHRDDSLLLDGGRVLCPREPSEIEASFAKLNLKPVPVLDDTFWKRSIKSHATESPQFGGVGNVGVSNGGAPSTGTGGAPDVQGKLATEVSHESIAMISEFGQEWKSIGLDIDDDSDFEDNILQATRMDYDAQPKKVTPKVTNKRSDMFEKRPIEVSAEQKTDSKLTGKLTAKGGDPREQYLEAISGARSNGVKFMIHMSRNALQITVKPDCSTHLAIGYALLQANADPGDANMYTLRLAEDDGAPDEDFPALDRVRPLASYHVDEFALVRATPAEFRENSKRTPNKVPFLTVPVASAASVTPSGTTPVTPSAASSAVNSSGPVGPPSAPFSGLTAPLGPVGASPVPTGISPFPMGAPPLPPTNNSRPKSAGRVPSAAREQASYPPPASPTDRPEHPSPQPSTFLGKTVRSKPGSLSGTKLEPVAVRIFMYPYDPLLSTVFWSDEMSTRLTRIQDVFEQMCREKMMDSEMYILRTANKQPVDLNSTLGMLLRSPSSSFSSSDSRSPEVDLEVVALRNIGHSRPRAESTDDTRRRPSRFSGDITQKDSKDKDAKDNDKDILQSTVLAMQPFGFYKYAVIRRQQMSFLGRSERELVIDGEFVHIMPPSDRSLLDQPKTTTFHLRQVLRVKQSRKVATNFSIMVNKPTGPKRYALESSNPQTTSEIVSRLQRMKAGRGRS